MILSATAGLIIFLLILSLILIHRSRRYSRHQAKLDAAFERAQVLRMRHPPGLYGETAWSMLSSRRSTSSQITLLNFR